VWDFLKKAFGDMKEDARAQREVDRQAFAAERAESKARWEEAKALGSPEHHRAARQAARAEKLAQDKEREAAAKARIREARGIK